jgi:signal transduction histidine kinase
MYAAQDSFSVLRDFLRSTTFRSTAAVAGVFAVYIAVLFAIVYWRTDQYLMDRSDEVITMRATELASATPQRRLDAIADLVKQDPRMVQYFAVFAPDQRPIAGNLAYLPPDLKIDGPAQEMVFPARTGHRQIARGIARRLPNGDVLVVGRVVEEAAEIAGIVGATLGLGLIPAFCLSIAAGVFLSVRAQKRVAEVNNKVQRIMAGDLGERLPARGGRDPLDRLAVIVNGMLDNIEALIQEIAGVGDDIAHDLRTPLTRVRVRLERGRKRATTLEELQTVVDRAIAGLDQSLAIMTALLRIAEIEHARRLEGFGKVSLAALLHDVRELYDPIAEDRRVTLRVQTADEAIVHGDRDLLFEAIANLVDNALKFTPAGGRVDLGLVRRDDEAAIQVRDTGPGISESESKAVTKRFYRSDKSRTSTGLGLGLSLVAAIVKLHNFRFTITPGEGCTAEIACPEVLRHLNSASSLLGQTAHALSLGEAQL